MLACGNVSRTTHECKYLLARFGMLTAEALAQLAHRAELANPSIVVRRLDPPAWEVTLEPGMRLSPASMIKVPLAVALWATQKLAPRDPVKVSERNLTANDAASPLVAGYEATVEELATLMLTRSDNVATNEIIDLVGRATANAFLHGIGLSGTTIARKLSGSLPLIEDPEATGRNAHPAADSARLFTAIANGTVPRAAWMEATLQRQEWNEKLSRGLRPGDRFAHKTGDTDEVTHDGGILELEAGGRYVVVVYSALASSPQNDERFASFMSELRPLLCAYRP